MVVDVDVQGIASVFSDKGPSVKSLRVLRVLRPLRTVRRMPRVQVMAESVALVIRDRTLYSTMEYSCTPALTHLVGFVGR